MNNLKMLQKRLETRGGASQESRMIAGKAWTLQRALKYSYQGSNVRKVQSFDQGLAEEGEYPWARALINPDKVKQDYDDKILSIDYSSGFQPGDVFEWKLDRLGMPPESTYWIVYLEELTEDAYFRGEVRRCRYQISFKDENGDICTTWAAIRGPVETQIDSIQKNQIRLDRPNLSLNILLPRNEKTLKAFDRYQEFILDGKCWRVEAPDSISVRNIIEVNAEEYFVNRDTDNDVKNGLVVKPVDLTPDTEIKGESFILPKIAENYFSPEQGGKWCVLEEDAPVIITPKGSAQVEVIWNKTTSGQFTLRWSKNGKEVTKVIVVNSLMGGC